MFPNGLSINLENRQYLTDEVNSFFNLTSSISRESKQEEKEKVNDEADLSCLVAGLDSNQLPSGYEPDDSNWFTKLDHTHTHSIFFTLF